MPLLISGRSLSKTYGRGANQVQALRGVDIDIGQAEMIAITGPSGSGKSTLMHVLGLLQQPDPGSRLLVRGDDVSVRTDGERTRLRATLVGFVFQSFNLIPTLSALENVQLAAEYAGLTESEGLRKAKGLLDEVGLTSRMRAKPPELSGGEQQRVALARALVNEPAVVLADEPTGNLDTDRSVEVLEMFRRFNRERAQAFVIVTHDRDVASLCDREISVRDGRLRDPAAERSVA